MSGYFDLGRYTRPVRTASLDAQTWFDRGLVWTYAFNHEEAVRCFDRAIEADPDCAMAYWGLAYALGPNYNKPWEFFDDVDLSSAVSRAYTATQEAVKRSHSAVEGALAKALTARYPTSEPAANCSVWNTAYCDAMEQVYRDRTIWMWSPCTPMRS